MHGGQEDDAGDARGEAEAIATRDAVRRLLQQGPLTIAELAKATGRSRTTVFGYLPTP